MGQVAAGTFHFGEERFAVEVKVDTADPSDPFIELNHQTRDWREGDRVVRDRVRLVWTEPTMARGAGGFNARELTADRKAIPAEWWLAFLEPPSLRPRLRLPA